MTTGILARGERAHPAFFGLGALSVTLGGVLHVPMYIKSAAMNFHLAGMPFRCDDAGRHGVHCRGHNRGLVWSAPGAAQTRTAGWHRRGNARRFGSASSRGGGKAEMGS